MAIKQIVVSCPHEGADKGKRFVITRMSAIAADRWGRHCLQAAAVSGNHLPGLDPEGGLAAVAAAGINIFAAMEPERMDGLIEALLNCVEMQPDPKNPEGLLSWAVAQTQIEEIPTISWLQAEAFKLHLDFFKGVGHLFSLLSLLLQTGISGPTPNSETSTSELPSS